MKKTYPIILTPTETTVVVYVPDFNINTEGEDLADAMEMARDAIGMVGIDMEDDNEALPLPSSLDSFSGKVKPGLITLVDVNFSEYRRKHDMRTVRRNVSLPAWLNAEAEKAGLNVSAVLQIALRTELNLFSGQSR